MSTTFIENIEDLEKLFNQIREDFGEDKNILISNEKTGQWSMRKPKKKGGATYYKCNFGVNGSLFKKDCLSNIYGDGTIGFTVLIVPKERFSEEKVEGKVKL